MQLSGDLTKVSFPNLLQLVRTGALTGIIAFNHDMNSATIMVENGYPCHAEAEGQQGLEALLELFLWNAGTFAFNEEDANYVSVCTDFELTKCTLEYILKEGMHYVESKKFLADIGVSMHSILKPIAKTKKIHPPEMSLLDGKKTLQEALDPLNLSKSMFVTTVADWIMDELAEPVSLGANKAEAVNPADASLAQHQGLGETRDIESIRLPPWVVARLRQENSNISKAIENMVVWTDRAKIWLYQLEGDFGKIRSVLDREQPGAIPALQPQNPGPAIGTEYGDVLTFTDDMENYPECGSASVDTDEPAEMQELSNPMPPALPFSQDSYLQGSGGYSYGYGSGMSSLGYLGQGRSNFSSFGGMRRHSYSSDATMFSLDHRSYDKDVMSNQRQPELPHMEVVYDSDDGGL
jgi:hypothetical protein